MALVRVWWLRQKESDGLAGLWQENRSPHRDHHELDGLGAYEGPVSVTVDWADGHRTKKQLEPESAQKVISR